MKIIISVLFLTCVFAQSAALEIHEDANLTTPQLIDKYGYNGETHYATTSDGYILTIHRILPKRNSNLTKKVVLLQHGILMSSSCWLIAGNEQGLGFLLANQGYDVWLGNFRGNSYSKNHTTLDPDKESEFWNYGWHEMGILDLPTIIDYILDKTKQTKLFYVGHSQGTTSFYVLLSMLPQYNDKIIAQFSLAPVAYLDHIKSFTLKSLAYTSAVSNFLYETSDVNSIFAGSTLLADTCMKSEKMLAFCEQRLYQIVGHNPKEMNKTILPVLLYQSSNGASRMQLNHYAQLVKSERFCQYDYGFWSNYGKYQSSTPTSYNLSAIDTSIYLLYSTNDYISSETDVLRLCKELGSSCTKKYLVKDKLFNHADYLTGIKVDKLVYSKILRWMTKL